MIKSLNKKIKKLDMLDVGLIKTASALFILFVIRIWPAAMNWVHSVNAWYFLIAAILFAIRPQVKCWKK